MLKRVTLACVLLVSFAMLSACDLFLVLTVTNDSPVQVCELYVSSSGDATWGADELGGYTLNPGASYDLLLIKGYYDLRFVDCIGEEGTLESIGLFENMEISYSY